MTPDRRADSAVGTGTDAAVATDDDATGADEESDDSRTLVADRFDGAGPVGRRVFVLVLVVGLFAVAFGVGRATVWLADVTIGVGEPGTISRLLAGVAGLQVLGFGIGVALVVWDREEPLSYLRVGSVDQWTAFYGAAVGLTMMLLTTAATLAFQMFDIEPAESTAAAAGDPLFYLVLVLVSTLVAVPMEEVFFRGIVQRSLEGVWHPAVAITAASLLFVMVHGGVTVGTGGEALVVGLFFAFGVVLGVSYHVTGNLLVPVIGHAVFNGAQTLTQAVDVLLS